VEGDGQRALFRIPGDAVQHRQGEALLALDIVDLYIGGLEFEVHGHAVGRLPGVVGEVLGGLDIVLVVVSPVKHDLLAVIRDAVIKHLAILFNRLPASQHQRMLLLGIASPEMKSPSW